MPILEYFLLAESVSIDQGTNRASIFHVLEEAHLQQPENYAILPQVVAISSWHIAPDERAKDFRLTLLVHPPGEEAPQKDTGQPHSFSLVAEPGPAPRRRVTWMFIGVTLDRPGNWRFELLIDGEHAANHFVEVLSEEDARERGKAAAAPK
jgi:hypothetical protein